MSRKARIAVYEPSHLGGTQRLALTWPLTVIHRRSNNQQKWVQDRREIGDNCMRSTYQRGFKFFSRSLTFHPRARPTPPARTGECPRRHHASRWALEPAIWDVF